MNEPRTQGWRRPAGRALSFTLFAVAAVQFACAAPPRPYPRNINTAPESLRAGLELYEAHEFDRAGAQFRSAGHSAREIGDRDLAHRALVAECTSWLRARNMPELRICAEGLQASQRRMRSSDPRVNTLIAMAAIAGGQPLPSLRTPSAVRVVLRGAAEGVQ